MTEVELKSQIRNYNQIVFQRKKVSGAMLQEVADWTVKTCQADEFQTQFMHLITEGKTMQAKNKHWANVAVVFGWIIFWKKIPVAGLFSYYRELYLLGDSSSPHLSCNTSPICIINQNGD